jgi:LysR family transcriptional regulator, hydrogen peroxide-inducible genes activator
MNLRDLRYIVALADLGHFGRAAEACHVSQPTLSGQILKLEEELGTAIFERSGRGLRPTSAGAEILVHARRAIAAADEIMTIAKASLDPLAGPLHLGVIPTLCPYLMPFVLPRLAQELPKMPLILTEDLTERLVEGVANGGLDAALIASEPEVPGLVSDVLFDEVFRLALPLDHRLAKQKTIATQDIDPHSLLLLTDGHCLRDQALAVCGAAGLPHDVRADMRAASLETLMQMVAAGYGMTLLPALALTEGKVLPKTLAIRKLKDPAMKRQIRLVSREKFPRAKAVEALGRVVKESVAGTPTM